MYKPLVYFDDTVLDYGRRIREYRGAWKETVIAYFKSLFPIITWITRYNLTWFSGDLIAGLTIGCVVIPQGMAYAKIATLPVEYGLYSSFTGVFIYCFFATSKDITIGPVAVMSLLLGTILHDLPKHAPVTKPEVGAALALLAGLIVLGIGLLRLGYIIDFISGPAIAGFMSGSALSIAIGQIANLFGIPGINTRVEPYVVLGNTLKHLGDSRLDAAFGLVSLFILYVIKFSAEYISNRFPKFKRPMFFINTSRSVLIIFFATIIAYCISKDDVDNPPIKLNPKVPKGLQHVGAANLDHYMVSFIGKNLPVVVLVLVLEHVAIAKSFGRLNDYTINPNQELIAIGIANILGSFFSSYPATGSFSRTAIKSKAGVRTPLAGIISGIVVIIAIYALTPAFRYIPSAALAAIIIHAVVDLFSGPSTWKQYWQVSPFEFLVFASGVIITFFTSVETGIYCSCGFSMFIMLTKIAHPRFSVLGRIPISKEEKDKGPHIYIPLQHQSIRTREELTPLPSGVVVVRIEEAYTYPNAAYLTDRLIEAGKASTRRGSPPPTTNGDRNWNDDGKGDIGKADLPILRAMVIDFGCVANMDSTALQGLSVARAALDRYAGRTVEWHFAHVADAKIRKALNAGGFGGKTPALTETQQLSMVPALNSLQRSNDDGIVLESIGGETEVERSTADLMPDEEALKEFIHYDLDDAVQAASRSPL